MGWGEIVSSIRLSGESPSREKKYSGKPSDLVIKEQMSEKVEDKCSYLHNAGDVFALMIFTVNTTDTNAERPTVDKAQLHQPELVMVALSVII